MKQSSLRNLIFLSFSQFGIGFSLNFINVFLPFYIIKISPYSSQTTLIWVGMIIGSTTLFAAITSIFWGSLTHHYSPKRLFLLGMTTHFVSCLLMVFTTNLYVLLLLRIFQGLAGGISTIGIIIVSSSAEKERMALDIGIFQTSITLSQLIGPPLGSLAAVLLGFKSAFLAASSVIVASFIFCHFYVTDIPILSRKERTPNRISIGRRVIIGWMLCFAAQIQLMFLPSVLPKVFEGFHIEQTLALKLSGTVVMLYTATSIVGTYVWSWLSKKIGVYRMIYFLFISGILFQSMLVLSRGIFDFTVIRMIQTGLIGATIPLILSLFANEPKGGVIGFLNSGRFSGSALGPMIATSILAFSDLRILYFSISALTLLSFLSFKFFFKKTQTV